MRPGRPRSGVYMAAHEQSRVIPVTERGTPVPVSLDERDLADIKKAGSRKAGVVWPLEDTPSEDAPERSSLLSVHHEKNGQCVIKAGSVVGFVGLPSGRVLHIKSKLGDVGVFWLLAHALDVARLITRWPELPATRDNFIEAILLLLRQEVRALVHAGLRKDYVPVEETLGVVRGRVLPARTIAETRGLQHRVTCLYDDYTADVFDNQVLRLALRAGAACSTGLRAALLGTDALFEGEVSFEPMNHTLAADKLKRLMDARHPSRRAYVAAHSLAYIVLRLLSYSDIGSSSRQPGVLLNMEKLFEKALQSMLEHEFGHAKFTHREIKFGATEPSVAKGLKPDISLRGLLVDAKYKEAPLTSRGTGMGLQPPDSDVFQAHTYSYFGKRPCALVYATGAETPHGEQLSGGLTQVAESDGPRVGLFCLNVAGRDVNLLEQGREKLIGSLRDFASLHAEVQQAVNALK